MHRGVASGNAQTAEHHALGSGHKFTGVCNALATHGESLERIDPFSRFLVYGLG